MLQPYIAPVRDYFRRCYLEKKRVYEAGNECSIFVQLQFHILYYDIHSCVRLIFFPVYYWHMYAGCVMNMRN